MSDLISFYIIRYNSNMTNKNKADLVALLHLGLILFGIISLPLLFIFDFWDTVVFVLAGLSVFSWVVYKGKCWITHLENHYRKKDGTNYEVGFIKHYLKKFLNINASSFIVGLLLYGYLGILFIIAFYI